MEQNRGEDPSEMAAWTAESATVEDNGVAEVVIESVETTSGDKPSIKVRGAGTLSDVLGVKRAAHLDKVTRENHAAARKLSRRVYGDSSSLWHRHRLRHR